MDRFRGRSTAKHVPGITCDGATRASYSHHLGDAFSRIGHEEDYQRHNGCIKTVVSEGKSHRVALPELRHASGGLARAKASCASEGSIP